MKKKRSFQVYFGGELFSAKHLVGNAYLAEAVFEQSQGRYRCVLPQNVERRKSAARSIRDADLKALLGCDAALLNYDGTEIESGTVVEFLFAKFADIPAVILRSDFRPAGDQSNEPWSLMSSFFPRTLPVVFDSLAHYKKAFKARRTLDDVSLLAGHYSSAAAQLACERIAADVVAALDRVLKMPAVMPRHLREEVYEWLALMPGFRSPKEVAREFRRALERKVDKDLL